MDDVSKTRREAASATSKVKGYTASRDHLRDHLTRLDMLARAHRAERIQDEKDGRLGTMVAGLSMLESDHAPSEPDQGLSPSALRAEAAEMARTIRLKETATPASIDLRLMRLCRLFELDGEARDLLLVALMPEIDDRHRHLFASLAGDMTRERPLVHLAFALLTIDPGRGRSLMHPDRPLLAWHLLAITETTPGGRLTDAELSVDHRIVDFLLDGDARDPALLAIISTESARLKLADMILPKPVSTAVAAITAKRSEPATVLLTGYPGTGKRSLAGAVARDLGCAPLFADVGALCRTGRTASALIKRTMREAMLRNALLAWHDLGELAEPSPEKSALLAELLEAADKASVPIWLLSSEVIEVFRRFRDRPLLRLGLKLPDFATSKALWRKLLSNRAGAPLPTGNIELLANGFQLSPGRMRDAIAFAEARAALRPDNERDLSLSDLFEGCRNQSSHGLQTLAQRIEPPAGLTFDDLVLPEDIRQQVDELRARIRLRGRIAEDLDLHRRLMTAHGLVALFSGPSGTGKTMTASLLALEQGVSLYRIDLAAIVSKWVGETEKNLDRILNEAESANAILFFDEADSLFGKRGEISQGQDRWANLELNFLLQRIEEFRGVAILATNLPNNIDEAFLRRLHIMIDFPFPEAQAREKIWRGLFPKGVGRPDDAAFAALAERFPIAGGHIRNTVLAALFQALDGMDADNAPPRVELRHLALALTREHQKLGRPITRSSFGKELYDLLPDSLRS